MFFQFCVFYTAEIYGFFLRNVNLKKFSSDVNQFYNFKQFFNINFQVWMGFKSKVWLNEQKMILSKEKKIPNYFKAHRVRKPKVEPNIDGCILVFSKIELLEEKVLRTFFTCKWENWPSWLKNSIKNKYVKRKLVLSKTICICSQQVVKDNKLLKWKHFAFLFSN